MQKESSFIDPLPYLMYITFEIYIPVIRDFRVIGLYVSLVLVIGKFVRIYIQGLSYKIMFVELPDPNPLYTLCLDIYTVRESGELSLEEELFAQLIFLYRSPETMIKVTKKKEKLDWVYSCFDFTLSSFHSMFEDHIQIWNRVYIFW